MFNWFKALTVGKQIAVGVGTFFAVTTAIGMASPAPTEEPAQEPAAQVQQDKIETKTVTLTETIDYASKQTEDPNLAKGKTTTVQSGIYGAKLVTYEITFINGQEQRRTKLSEEVTKEPTDEIVAIGTYVAPPPKPEPVAVQSTSSCDPNYSGGCVPIASDVDCGGGSGNGPAYFYGTAQVVGYDIYRLDGDNDGLACE